MADEQHTNSRRNALKTLFRGAGLLGIIKQTLNIPVTLVKPLDSGKKKEKSEDAESSDEPSGD